MTFASMHKTDARCMNKTVSLQDVDVVAKIDTSLGQAAGQNKQPPHLTAPSD